MALESIIKYYNWANNPTLLRTTTKTWLDQFRMTSEQTTLDNGQTSQDKYTWTGGVVTEKDEYDYGQSSPTRKTVTNYQSFSSTPGVIADKPCKTLIEDGNSNLFAETDYLYDGGTTICGTSGTPSITSVSNLPAGTHDETLFGPSSTTSRGNVTSITRKCVQGCSTSASTTHTYDETGQVLSATDACGNATCSDVTGTNHTTSFSYADSYTVLSGGQNISYSPSTNTNAFLAKITNALGQTHKFTYDFNNGQLTASTDANSQTIKYLYNDAFARPTLVNFPDGGQTTIAYNDSPYNSTTPSPSVTTTKVMTSTTNITSLVAFDGLGHLVKTLLPTDPDCASGASGDRTDTTYDGLGRVYTVSNPYCTTGDSTYGLTTYAYDALGRATKVTHPDNSTILTTYTGRATEFQDEGNGTQRVSRVSQTDALGRLNSLCEVAPGPFVGSGGSSSSSLIGSGGTPGPCSQDITTAGNGFQTNYLYDILGNLINVSQPGIAARTFNYDSLSRLLCASNPENSSATCPTTARSHSHGPRLGFTRQRLANRSFRLTFTRHCLTNLCRRSMSASS